MNKISLDMGSNQATKSCKEKIIISSTNKWKAIFDIFILILVGYSCVFSMLHVSFDLIETQGF